MKMIVGLGNPGTKYAGTRHNIGFDVIDELADRHQFSINKSLFDADFAEEFVHQEKVLFVKPMSYMNSSGQAIRPLANYFAVDLQDILIIYDDLDIDIGHVRFRLAGSAGGHNGMKDIINVMGSKEIKRARVGIGRPHPKQSVVQHVLSTFPKEDLPQVQEAVSHTADAVEFWLEEKNFEVLMTRFNK